MILKNYNIFNESKINKIQVKRPWIFKGSFKVLPYMVSNGSLIKELIPDQVSSSFSCFETQLTSLEGCPKKIGGNFNCTNNKLASLEGGPYEVLGDYSCTFNQLTSLKGCPKNFSKSFFCNNNNLTSLEGCPSLLGDYFSCHSNNLTSLEGGPISIDVEIYSFHNIHDLIIETRFIKSGSCSSQATYWPDLFKYMKKKKIDLNRVVGWPDEFIETLDDQYKNLLYSSKKLRKFKL